MSTRSVDSTSWGSLVRAQYRPYFPLQAIIQVWDSQEALDRFLEDQLRPAMERAGERGYPQPPRLTDIELTDLYV